MRTGQSWPFLVAVAPDHGLAVWRATKDPPHDNRVELRLTPEAEIRGVVLDDGGKPVPEATVSIWHVSAGHRPGSQCGRVGNGNDGQ